MLGVGICKKLRKVESLNLKLQPTLQLEWTCGHPEHHTQLHLIEDTRLRVPQIVSGKKNTIGLKWVAGETQQAGAEAQQALRPHHQLNDPHQAGPHATQEQRLPVHRLRVDLLLLLPDPPVPLLQQPEEVGEEVPAQQAQLLQVQQAQLGHAALLPLDGHHEEQALHKQEEVWIFCACWPKAADGSAVPAWAARNMNQAELEPEDENAGDDW